MAQSTNRKAQMFSLPIEMVEKMKRVSKEKGLTMSELLKRMIEYWFDNFGE